MSEPKEHPNTTNVEDSTELEIKSGVTAGGGLRDGYPDSDTVGADEGDSGYKK